MNEWPSKLPRGSHGLPRETVAGHQRKRLLAGAARAMACHGYADLTVEQILREAGVSRTSFYEHFENKRDCVVAAHGSSFERLAAALGEVCASGRPWPDRVALGVTTAIDYAAAAPEEAQLLALDAVGADPLLARQAIASTDHLVDLLRAGRRESERAAALPELTEGALVGAMTSVIAARLVAGQADSLPALKPQLVELMLMPYVGLEEARRIASGAGD